MFELLTKINIVINLIKFLKEYRFFTLSIFLFLISALVFIIGINQYNDDNSIYIDANSDGMLKQNIIEILKKCGDKNAIGLSAVSTIDKSQNNAKFKEIYSCDFAINPNNCIVDLSTEEFKLALDYLLDETTYHYIDKLATDEEILKIYLPEFDLDQFLTIKQLLENSNYYRKGEAKY